MADMANIDQVEEAWEEIAGITAIDRVVPITYMNSSAALKAFVGEQRRRGLHVVERPCGARVGVRARRQGAVLPRPAPRPQHRLRDGLRPSATCACGTRATSSAGSKSATSRKRRSCCGRATAPCTSGSGPRTSRRPRRAPGHRDRSCTPSARTTSSRWPTRSARPSASRTGCEEAAPGHGAGDRHRDPHGAAPRGAAPRQDDRVARPAVCPCSTMFRIDGPHLAWVLENLVAGTVVNQIVVDDDTDRVGQGRARAHARDHLTAGRFRPSCGRP